MSAGPLMHLLLDLIPCNLPAAGIEAVPHALRQRAAALFRSYALDRPSFARSVLKIAQVIVITRTLGSCCCCICVVHAAALSRAVQMAKHVPARAQSNNVRGGGDNKSSATCAAGVQPSKRRGR